MKLGQALILIRTAKKLNQEDIAAALSVSKSHICEMEKEKKNPSLDFLKSYADLLQVPVSSIFRLAERLDSEPLFFLD